MYAKELVKLLELNGWKKVRQKRKPLYNEKRKSNRGYSNT